MNCKIFMIALLFVPLFACESKVTEVTVSTPAPMEEKEPATAHPLVAKITSVLQQGWEVSQNGNTIVVTRNEPVPTYVNVNMPDARLAWRILKEEKPLMLRYQITIEIKPRVSKAQYRNLQKSNDETRAELSSMRDAMKGFRSKVDFSARNDAQQKQYEEYRRGLRELPYQQLPDLYDDSNSYYVTTTRHPRESFVYPREERECRAVLENILSFADGYQDFSDATTEGEYFHLRNDELVGKVFNSERDFDSYLLNREDNLPELRPTPLP